MTDLRSDYQKQIEADEDFLSELDSTEPWDPLPDHVRPRSTPEERRAAANLGADTGMGGDSLTAGDIEAMSDEHFLNWDFLTDLPEGENL